MWAPALALLASIGFVGPAWAQSCASNSAPTVDMTQISNGTWCGTQGACTVQTAPTETDASKPFAGVFADADGDDLTYTAGIDDDSTGKMSAFSSFGVNAATSRLSVQAKAGAQLLDVTPALPSPFGTLVYLDATDPCGETVRVYGKFTTSWTDVDSVEIVSMPSGGSYDAGDKILVRVTFSGVVTVDPTNGTPRLKIDLDTTANSGERWANYESGSGTTTLTFGYTVATADTSTDGIAVVKATLESNGGTIQMEGQAADLLHRGLAHDTLHRVARPVIDVVEIANDPSRDSTGSGAYGAFDTYVAGDEIRIDVKFNEPVVVTGGGDVRLRLDLGTDDATPGNSRKTLTHPSMLNGGRTLRFSYAVTSSDTDPDGVWVQTGASNRVIFEPHDDQRVVSAATGVDADLTLSGLPTTGNARKKVDGSASASGPRPSSATVDGKTVKVTFDAALDESVDTGALVYFFSVQDAGGVNSGNIGAHQHPLSVSVSGSTVTLALGNGARAGETITLNYKYLALQRLLRDTDGNAAPEIKDLPLTNITGGAAGPGPVRAWLEGSSLRIAFAGDLDGSSQPAGSAFLVRTEDLDGNGRAIPGTGTASVTGSEVAVTLTTVSLRPNEEVVSASYAKPSANPLRGVGGDVRSFDQFDMAPTYVVKPRPALTASFHGTPAKHDGKRPFEFELRFSEEFKGLRLSALEAGALQVTNGRLIDAKRTVRGENHRITARVRPNSDEAMTLTLAATDDCDATDAICAADGRKLSAPVAATVAGPTPAQPTLSVAAAAADEGGALLFAVALSEPAAIEVTADYATSDGSATAGTDYESASGTLTFAAGETEKTITVRALTDEIAEAAETFTLALTNADGATLGTGSATGTIEDAPPPLTAVFHGLPDEHDGSKLFGFEIRFSEEFRGFTLTAFRQALQVTAGRLVDARRTVRGQNRSVTVRVRPSAFDDLVLSLPATTDCAAASAICTSDGRKLSNTVTATVRGPVAVSVADAEAQEGAGAAVAFRVSLNRAASSAVTVDYATRDGTAAAGEDYAFTRGTLSFAAGETEKSVEVPILDDALDEGNETFTLKLTGARGAAVDDGEATGTIRNSDPLQKMWLSRFGRTVADHVTGAVTDRLSGPLAGAQVTVDGQAVNLAQVEDEAFLGRMLTSIAQVMGAPSGPAPANDPGSDALGLDPGQAGADGWPGTGPGVAEAPTFATASARSVTGRELLLGSAFHLAMDGDGGRPGLAAWGRATVGGFDGEAPADAGTVRVDGDVMTGILGTDAAWDRVLVGVAVSLSEGEGTSDQPGIDSGTVESTMTTVSPYARVALSERLSAWGLAGMGIGDMTVVQAANDRGQPERTTRTDLAMRLAAVGGRGALLTPEASGGFDLALKADAFFVETTSEAVASEGDTSADASRVRLVLEGSRAFTTGTGMFTPGLELGLRHDGGDAETGTGVELGGRVSYTDPHSGLSLEASVRALVAHEDSDYEEWGASGALRLAPGERGRGLSFSLTPTYGAPGSGTDRLWSARDAGGLGAGGGTFEPESRLEGELGHGLALPGGFLGTPNVGFALANGGRDFRVGWRLSAAGGGFEVNLDATRSEPTDDDGSGAAPEHGVVLRAGVRW